MQDADLFMDLAAIAGVFVGFGALIAVRSGGAAGERKSRGCAASCRWGRSQSWPPSPR